MKSALAVSALVLALAPSGASAQDRPNVIVVYADDLGYGDVSAYGPPGRMKTPHVDRLAREGLRFTDGHSPAATCTPSRYAMLTGEYAFRKPGTGVLPGDAALVIEPGRTSLATVFQKAGYATGVVGKWHLGLGPAGGPDWNGEIRPGPLEIGFDSAFIMAATGDRVPTVYVENRRVANLDPADPIRVNYGEPVGDWPTGRGSPQLLKLHPSHGHDQTIVNGISRIGYMTGGKTALWKDEEMGDVFTRRAIAFIEQHRAKPFFLYFALHEPHVPRVPHPRFAGATSMGPRGDAIAQLDSSIGELLSTLDRLGLTRNTLVLFTSDNGPVVDDGYRDRAVELLGDHRPAGPFRGGKYSTFEGGTRVPLIVRWPARVKPGISNALVSQVDFLASFAALLGQPVTGISPSDSENVLPALLGQSQAGRAALVEQSGARVALREGAWKYIPPSQGPRIQANTNTELGNDPEPQLYDLTGDPGERNNLAAAQPERVRAMAATLDRLRRRQQPAAARRPNIVIAIADDWSYPHTSSDGDRTVRTPAFDRIAREGARFTHAFVASPSCTPSRAALLAGQAVHRLQEGANLHGFLPKAIPVLPDLLEEAGYVVGFSGKGWGPGRFEPGGRARNPAGPQFKSFDDFMAARPGDRPFSFWFGSSDPHRPYEEGSGARAGLAIDRVSVPGYLPDTPIVRGDLLDYYLEVQRFDRDVARMLETLERAGELENTIVIVTSDNGMPFPRAKANVYDGGARVPLAIRWPAVAARGTVVDALVSLTDLAPTLLEAAGLKPVAAMTGRTLLPLLRGDPQGGREQVFIERERHANVRRGDLSYPVRAIRTKDYLYIRNFRPDRWPAGDPELYFAVGPFGDIDGGPAKTLLLDARSDPAIARFFSLATAKRPAEELYDLRRDPDQITNLAGTPSHRAEQRRLRDRLDRWLRETGDPRAREDDDRWDRMPYYGQPVK
ncbi:MAG TPA: sulfatase-like hydrolase/transferase [Vicinamibacterales bacterium]|nr:sulfatase-like hydrolase/transferase [Vicinamibacterales bacterium]